MLDIDQLASDVHWLTDLTVVLTVITVVIGIIAIEAAVQIKRHKRGK